MHLGFTATCSHSHPYLEHYHLSRRCIMPTPFFSQVFTFTQPDGSPIQLRGWGDQHYAVFETLDGYTVTQNPATGYWEVARLTADGNALEPASAAGSRLDGLRAGVPRGLRVRREVAMAAG